MTAITDTRSKGKIMHVDIEVCRHANAPWAPALPGARWAWRVTGLGGNPVIGASLGGRDDALAKARVTARRMVDLQSSGFANKEFRIVPSKFPSAREED